MDNREELLKQVRKQVKATNRKLKTLDAKGFYNSFSSKKLFERLGGSNSMLKESQGKVLGVKIKKNVTMSDLHKLAKATKNFLQSETSTPRSIKNVVKRTKESMYQTLKLEQGRDISMADIETYYDMLGDKDFDYFNTIDRIGASELWAMIDEAIDRDLSQNEFIKMFDRANIDINDLDVKEKIINIYNKYVL